LYVYRIEKRDVVAYPLNGYLLQYTIEKLGLFSKDDINQLEITGVAHKYQHLGKKFYFSTQIKGKTSFPSSQPYSHQRGLGYGQDFLRGYELYVVDGQSYLSAKNTLRKQIFNVVKDMEGFSPVEQFSTLPVALYAKIYADAGYVRNYYAEPDNTLFSNKFLASTGVGFDLVTFYDLAFKFEFSYNQKNELRFFFSFRGEL
jgi:hypothetical protein